jgi:hypothetical protein
LPFQQVNKLINYNLIEYNLIFWFILTISKINLMHKVKKNVFSINYEKCVFD